MLGADDFCGIFNIDSRLTSVSLTTNPLPQRYIVILLITPIWHNSSTVEAIKKTETILISKLNHFFSRTPTAELKFQMFPANAKSQVHVNTQSFWIEANFSELSSRSLCFSSIKWFLYLRVVWYLVFYSYTLFRMIKIKDLKKRDKLGTCSFNETYST